VGRTGGGRWSALRYACGVTSPDERPQSTAPASSLPPVEYKGEPLDAARGPGLGCFWIQLVLLAVLVVLTPASVYIGWPDWLSAALLFITVAITLVAGQTIIFLLRLVAADRRSRRRPLASATKTVGELEDERRDEEPGAPTDAGDDGPAGDDPVRQ